MGADLEAVFVEFGEAGAVAFFEDGAVFGFFWRLHPERLGDVGDGFGQALQGGGPPCRRRRKSIDIQMTYNYPEAWLY